MKYQNNTLNKVRAAATEQPQLMSQNTNMFGEAIAQLCAALKLTEKSMHHGIAAFLA